MSRHSFPPDDHRVHGTVVVRNLPAWLEWIKETTGYSDNTLAICLGTDARQVDRWRNKGVVPSGGAMAALVLLAERIPGAHNGLSRTERSAPSSDAGRCSSRPYQWRERGFRGSIPLPARIPARPLAEGPSPRLFLLVPLAGSGQDEGREHQGHQSCDYHYRPPERVQPVALRHVYAENGQERDEEKGEQHP